MSEAMDQTQIKKDIVFDRLHEMIVNGYFRPGENLSEREIAVMFGVSRTPVREAFRRMEKEGIVNYEPKRGVTIPTFTIEEIIQLYTVREYLEGLASRLLAEKRDEMVIGELRRNIEKAVLAAKENNAQWQAVINGHFHQLIAEGTKNMYLNHAFKGLRSNFSLMRSTSLTYQDRLITNLEEHIQICEAIASGDADRAEQSARLHVKSSMKSTLSKFGIEQV